MLKPIHNSIISLLIIRFYDSHLWGSFVVFLVAIELFSTFVNWGQKPFLLRAFSVRPGFMGEQWLATAYSRVFFLVLVLVVLFLVPSLKIYFLPLSLWFILKWLSSLTEPVVQFYRKYSRAILAEITAIATAVICIWFLFKQMNLETLLYIFVLSTFMKLLVLLPLMKYMKRVEAFSLKLVKMEIIASFPFFALSITGLLQTKSDLYIATYFLNEQSTANYQIMIGFLLLGQALATTLIGPFQKNIYRWGNTGIKKVKRLYIIGGIIISVLYSIFLYMALWYVYFIRLEVWFLFLFFIYLLPLYTFLIESQILLKHNGEKQLLYCSLIATLFNLGMSVLLIPSWGILGALLSGIAGNIMLAIVVINQHNKKKLDAKFQ